MRLGNLGYGQLLVRSQLREERRKHRAAVRPPHKNVPHKDILTNKDDSVSPPTFSRGK